MKLVLDESRKHQLIGFIVILSIAAILIPAIMKNPNESLDKSIKLSVKLPDKPKVPVVAEPTQNEMFQSVKVAQVDLSRQVEQKPLILAHAVKAEPISSNPTVKVAKSNIKSHEGRQETAGLSKEETQNLPAKAVKLAQNNKVIPKTSHPVAVKNKPLYAVQIASFAVENNAKGLVEKLKNVGYKASYQKAQGQSMYKVIVGAIHQKQDAKNIQKELAKSIHLEGIVIKIGVS